MPRRLIACLLIFSSAFSQAAQAYTQDWLPQRGAALKLANISAGPSTGLRTGGGLNVNAAGGVAIDIPTVQATQAPPAQTDAQGYLIPPVPLTAEQQAAQ